MHEMESFLLIIYRIKFASYIEKNDTYEVSIGYYVSMETLELLMTDIAKLLGFITIISSIIESSSLKVLF